MLRFAVVGPVAVLAMLGGASAVASDSRVAELPISGAALSAGAALSPGAAVVDYVAPTSELDIVRGFDPPATAYGAGHLGVDLRAAAGSVIRSAADGVVRIAGPVAGRGVVVIGHPDGVRTEYEPVRPLVAVGTSVRRGQPVGVLAGSHRGCPGSCLHWGARRGSVYLDPPALLRRLAPVRLLPWPAGRSP